MSIGYMAKCHSNVFDGSSKVAAGKTVKNGSFVDLTVAANGNTADLCGVLPTVKPWFVSNEDDTVEPTAPDTVNIVLVEGTPLKMKSVLAGEEIVTDEAAAALVVGDKCFATAGVLKVLVAEPAVQIFQILEVFVVDGKTCYRAIALN